MPANGVIELAFDRLLLPASITRQTFILGTNPPLVAYDPVSRVVTITPTVVLVPGDVYELKIASPLSPADLNGLRAIDGAQLDPKLPSLIAFVVTTATTPPTPPQVDFCHDVLPIFQTGCVGTGCHSYTSAASPAAGLGLTTAEYVSTTAIGRVANGANTGPRATPESPGLTFGLDMPIVDPGSGHAGNAGDSWLVYKLLLAEPADAGAGAAAADSGAPAPTDLSNAYSVAWSPLSDAERRVLSTFVPGRETPFHVVPNPGVGLTVNQLELVSFWIQQGATVPTTCP